MNGILGRLFLNAAFPVAIVIVGTGWLVNAKAGLCGENEAILGLTCRPDESSTSLRIAFVLPALALAVWLGLVRRRARIAWREFVIEQGEVQPSPPRWVRATIAQWFVLLIGFIGLFVFGSEPAFETDDSTPVVSLIVILVAAAFSALMHGSWRSDALERRTEKRLRKERLRGGKGVLERGQEEAGEGEPQRSGVVEFDGRVVSPNPHRGPLGGSKCAAWFIIGDVEYRSSETSFDNIGPYVSPSLGEWDVDSDYPVMRRTITHKMKSSQILERTVTDHWVEDVGEVDRSIGTIEVEADGHRFRLDVGTVQADPNRRVPLVRLSRRRHRDLRRRIMGMATMGRPTGAWAHQPIFRKGEKVRFGGVVGWNGGEPTIQSDAFIAQR